MISQVENSKDFTILYVEDEVSIRLSVETCLKSIFNMVCAKNGQEALEKFKSNKIDLIVTDINMPVKNGISMMEELREISPKIPIIVTSAYDEEENMKKILKLNAYKYLSKPFDMKELVMNIMSALK